MDMMFCYVLQCGSYCILIPELYALHLHVPNTLIGFAFGESALDIHYHDGMTIGSSLLLYFSSPC